MSSTKGFERDQQDQILLDSIRHQRPVVLTQSTPQGWRVVKAAFLCGSPESGELTARVLKEDNEANPTPPPFGTRLGGTFRLGHKKCMFSGQVRAVHPHGECDDFVLSWPEQMQQLQRRAYERAAPPPGTVIAVRFWREGSDTSNEARVVRHGQLEDVSCGGIRIKVPDPTELVIGCTYKCVFTPKPGKPAIVVDTILRHREAVEQGRASLGFQFVGLETSPERLRTLDRLARMVRHFQRVKARPVHAFEE
jgi:hypothetical protein